MLKKNYTLRVSKLWALAVGEPRPIPLLLPVITLSPLYPNVFIFLLHIDHVLVSSIGTIQVGYRDNNEGETKYA